ITPAIPLPEEIENTATQRRAAIATQEAVFARLRQIRDAYNAEKQPNEFQGNVCEAAELLLQVQPLLLQITAPDLTNQQHAHALTTPVAQIRMNIAIAPSKLDAMTEELFHFRNDRAKQAKTWQAYYDYVSAQTHARVAHVYEYNFQLGQMRKDFPPLDPGKQEGWQLVAGGAIRDADAAKYARQAKTYLEKLIQEQEGSVWAKAAKAELEGVQTGLQWEAYSKK